METFIDQIGAEIQAYKNTMIIKKHSFGFHCLNVMGDPAASLKRILRNYSLKFRVSHAIVYYTFDSQ